MSIPAFDIGPVRVDPGLLLAPMSGVTDSPFRRLVKRCSGDAVGLLVSDFISIEGLTRNIMRSKIRMMFHAEERPVAIQIFGADADLMAEAAKIVEDSGAEIVDINCGCPAPKVVKRGGGAGLLQNLPNLEKIVHIELDHVKDRLAELKLKIKLSEEAIAHLIKEGTNPDFGARPLRRAAP